MFEKVLAGERRRAHQRTRAALIASIGAHTVLALGAARVPLGATGEPTATEEVVSFMDLPAPVEAAKPEAPPAPVPQETNAQRLAAGPGAIPESDLTASELPAVPDHLPQVRADLAIPVSVVSAPELHLPSYLLTAAQNRPGSGAIVEADVLAERPRLTNRWEMEQVWKQLYPMMLERAGVTGETVVSFVIDEDGRVIPESVELISASRREFGEAVLRGVLRLRFRPMMVGGSPVRVRTTLPVLWRLA